MAGRILTPLEVSALKNLNNQASPDDWDNLISTVEDAWAERDHYRRLIDSVWDKFGEISRLIREKLKTTR